MIHYGGDSGETSTTGRARSTSSPTPSSSTTTTTRTTIALRCSRPRPTTSRIDARNNVFASSLEPTELRAVTFLGDRDGVAAGALTLSGNWVTNGWLPFDPLREVVKVIGQVDGLDDSHFGVESGVRVGGRPRLHAGRERAAHRRRRLPRRPPVRSSTSTRRTSKARARNDSAQASQSARSAVARAVQSRAARLTPQPAGSTPTTRSARP